MSTASGERRLRLAASRQTLFTLPLYELFELPGRPHVVWMLTSYADAPNAEQARNDIPFLFRSFESGQVGPKRMAKLHGGKPRMSTIHEYLDWTVTAQAAQEDDELVSDGVAVRGGGWAAGGHPRRATHRVQAAGPRAVTASHFLVQPAMHPTLGTNASRVHIAPQDFGGFRVLILLPRYVSHWPIPQHPGNIAGKRASSSLGPPLPPMPFLQTHGRALCAATIRSGPGYLEIPFVATHEGKRGRGYCRCVVCWCVRVRRWMWYQHRNRIHVCG
jgi:hypothetical protein